MSDVTLDEVRRRAAAAGLTLSDAQLTAMQRMLADTLGPLRRTDANAIRTVEPAVTFDADGGARE
jgi:hypothetical protein